MNITKTRVVNSIVFIVLLLAAFLFILPVLWWIVFAVKGSATLTIGRTLREVWIPNEFLLFKNIKHALDLYPMGRFYINSIIVASIVTFLELFISSISGYAFAKYKFVGRNFIFLIILAMLMIPQIIVVIPLFEIVIKMNLPNTYVALILPFMVTPFGIFMMRQFAYEIPSEYIEAGRVEGVGEFRIFFTIGFPMLRSAFATLGIFTFLRQWDYLLWPLITLSKQEMYTLAVGVSLLQTNVQVPYNAIYAITLVFSLPVLLIYFLLQKLVIQSLSMTGLKG